MDNKKDNVNILNTVVELIAKEDFLTAKDMLVNAISNGLTNIEAYKNLGLCELNLDSPPDAIAAFEKVLELDSDDVSSMFYLACCKSRLGFKEESVALFKKVISMRPDYLDAYNNLAMIYVEFKDIDSSIELLNSALANPNITPDYSLYYILATCYMIKKDYDSACKNLELANKEEPLNMSVLNSLSTCYLNSNKKEKAIDVLNKAYEIDPKNTLTLYNLGVYYQSESDYKNALKYFQESYNIEPSITMLSSLAYCALNANEYHLAVSLYQNLVLAYPNNYTYRMSYIDALEKIKNYDMALQNVKILLATDDKDVVLLKKKATLLRKLGNFNESIDTFESLIKRGKIDVEVYYNLAYNYVELEDFDNASLMFKKCIMLEPDNPYVHKDLGVLYLNMNQYDWAADEIKQAIELENDVAEFYYSLGVVYMMLSDINSAKEMFLKAKELDENDGDNLAYLGYAYMLENKLDDAFEILKKAVSAAPDNFLVKLHFAKYYFVQKNYIAAKQFLLDAVVKTKDDETLNMLAICYKETDEAENAMGIFSKLIKTYPNNHVLLTNLAECEYKCGKIIESKDHIRLALNIFSDFEPALKLLKEINDDK